MLPAGTLDYSGLPRGDVGERLLMEYVRRKGTSDVSYGVQFTDKLQSNWTGSVTTESVVPVNDLWERVTVQDHLTTGQATNRFGRVIVIQN